MLPGCVKHWLGRKVKVKHVFFKDEETYWWTQDFNVTMGVEV